MIASDSPQATAAARQIMLAGGNIIDAATALTFAISVTRPQSTGLGGGGFLLYHTVVDGRTRTFDFRERAPASATAEAFLSPAGNRLRKRALFHPISAGVPGNVAGIVEIHAKAGLLPLPRVMQPAIQLAREGFKIYPTLAMAISSSRAEMDASMLAVFAPGNQNLRTGDILRQKDLAHSLELISTHGSAVFYKGEIAHKIVLYMQKNEGLISATDLANYRMLERAPISIEYRGHRIISMPPPSSGVFILNMLKQLETIDLKTIYTQDRPGYYAYLAEVMRRGYAERAAVGGDPDFVHIPVARLLSSDYARLQTASINPFQASKAREIQNLNQRPESTETTHFVIMDREGNTVSSTQSINYVFGARRMVPNTGIILNDTMDDFVLKAGQANAYGLSGSTSNLIGPGRTPLSSMSPTIVFEKSNLKHPARPRLALGAPGGAQIITSILQTLVHDLDLDMHPYASVAQSRLHYYQARDTLLLERRLGKQTILEKMQLHGFNARVHAGYAKVFLVKSTEHGLLGVSDPRGDGIPASEVIIQ